MKYQGRRTDLTSAQVEPKLDNNTLTIYPLKALYDENGEWKVVNYEINRKGYRSNTELAKQAGESVHQIKRYIRLTNLIPKILDMVDDKKIAFTVAVELSYLKEEEQNELHAVMDLEQCTPSLSQANRLKRLSQAEELDIDAIYAVMGEEKPNQKLQIKIRADRVERYFPKDFTEKQKVELIEKLLQEWHGHQPKKEQRLVRSR